MASFTDQSTPQTSIPSPQESVSRLDIIQNQLHLLGSRLHDVVCLKLRRPPNSPPSLGCKCTPKTPFDVSKYIYIKRGDNVNDYGGTYFPPSCTLTISGGQPSASPICSTI